MPEGYLFSERSLSGWLARREEEAVAAARSIPPERVLQVPEADLVDELMERYEANPPVLRMEERYTGGAEDAEIDVSQDPRRVIFDRGRPVYIPGTRVRVHVPFDGDPALFRFTPSTFTTVLPRGEIRGQELVVTHEVPADSLSPEEFQRRLDEEIGRIQQYLAWVTRDCESFNQGLRRRLERAVHDRREKVLTDRNLEAFLKIPVGRRPDASPVFAVPLPKRKRPVRAVPAHRRATVPFSPEPAISDEDYAAILKTITDWRAAVERLPETFGPMGEEALRDSLLVVLNNQFGTGGGELFSRKGKTDLFIQHDKGAVFIAECKVWSGPKAFAGALDQLLGYLVWRDTKSALVLFVRRKNVSDVQAKADAVIRGHPRFKRERGVVGGVPVYVLHHEDDANREIEVALVIVPLPPVS
jgi:hypothetical protein